jgi:TonB family protein
VNTRTVAVLAAILLTSLVVVKAQEEERVYLNEVLASTAKKSAKYYRINEGRDGDLFMGRTYSIEGRLKVEGTYADRELRVEHGSFTFYHANGAVESKGEYVMGNKSGVWERFGPYGEALAEKIYNPVPLENIVYTRAETMPRHGRGSDKEFVRHIRDNMITPNGKRVKGAVMACFIVEKNGMLSDVKVVNGKNAELDQQVVEAIKSSAPWQPGMDRGQPVRVSIRMPVQF